MIKHFGHEDIKHYLYIHNVQWISLEWNGMITTTVDLLQDTFLVVKISGKSVHLNAVLCIRFVYSVWVSTTSASIGHQLAGRTSGYSR